METWSNRRLFTVALVALGAAARDRALLHKLCRVAAIGWFAAQGRWAQTEPIRLVALMVGAALALGVIWEVFEWLSGSIGTPRDTIIDLLMDIGGAVAAGIMIDRIRRR